MLKSGLYGGPAYMGVSLYTEFEPISATLIHLKAHTLTLSRSFTTFFDVFGAITVKPRLLQGFGRKVKMGQILQ